MWQELTARFFREGLSPAACFLWAAGPLAAGFLADLLLGDPPFMPHPIRLIGWCIEKGERGVRRVFPHTQGGLLAAGSVLAAGVAALSFLVPWAILLALAAVHPALAFLAQGVMCYQILAIKALKTESMKVYHALEGTEQEGGCDRGGGREEGCDRGGGHGQRSNEDGARLQGDNAGGGCQQASDEKGGCQQGSDEKGGRQQRLERARRAVSMIVGRDTEELTAEQVAKAAIETVAENTSDGTVAPLFYMALGAAVGGVFGLPLLGAPVGFLYKAVNTMDSMLGYKNDKYLYFGRTAARLDDGANFLPARISAVLMIAGAWILGMNYRNAARIFKRDRFNHASPNSAQTESVCAGALGIRLAGDAYYFGKLYPKKNIGDALRPVERQDILRANRLLYATAWLCLLASLAACFAVFQALCGPAAI